MKTLTMETAAALLGYPKPAAHRQRVCADCEGELWEVVEYSARCPWGTGYLVWACEECGEMTEDRRWVGH